MADIYSLTIRADTRDVTRARQALAGLADGSLRAKLAAEGVTDQYVRLRRSIDPAYASQQDFNRSLKVLQSELKQGNISLGQYNADLANLQRTAQVATRRGFTPMRGAVQQAGFQIGDFAVQVGAGQNALVAFAQQGSQLAGIFGPGGAVIGAIIAIGGAIAGGFARSMGEGGESVEELAEKTKQLTEELGRATDAQARFVRGQFAQQAAEQRDIIKEQQEELEFLNVRMERFIETNRRVGVPLDAIKENGAYLSLAEQAEEARIRIDNANAALEAGDLSLQEYEDAISGVSEEAQTAAERLDSMIESIQVQADTLGLSARETALYEAARFGANAADIEAINNSFDLIESYRQQQQAQKALIESTKISVKDDPMLQRIEAERRGQEILLQQQQDYTEARERLDGNMLSSATSTASALAGAIGDMAGKQSAAYQAAFVAQQAFAIASAIINTQMAAAAALAPPPIGLGPVAGAPYAAFVEGLGAANVAIIAAQTITGLAEAQSGARMHGGSVSAGGRYLVGEDGPEIVTMGGSGVVTPSSVMGTGEPSMPNITVNMIEDNARSGQVEQRRRDDGSVEINAFVSDITSGGRRAKVMESVYGLRRSGR